MLAPTTHNKWGKEVQSSRPNVFTLNTNKSERASERMNEKEWMSERMNEKLPFLNSQKKNHFFTQHNKISIRSLLRTKERRNFNEKKWLIYRFSALHPQMREREKEW
jgi:SET domain-containing protein